MGEYVVTERSAKRGPGQPTKRTPALEALVLEHLRRGRSRAHTERLVKLSHGALRHWEKADSSFSSQVAQAIAEGEDRRLRILEAAAGSEEDPKDPKVIQWLLAKQFPQKYGERARLDAHVRLGLEKLDDRQLEERIARLEASAGRVSAAARRKGAKAVEETEE